jgi:hypothetical protein
VHRLQHQLHLLQRGLPHLHQVHHRLLLPEP